MSRNQPETGDALGFSLTVGWALWFVILIGGMVALGVWGTPNDASEAADVPHYRIFGEGSGEIVEVALDATETEQEISPGVTYQVWTFGGVTPAPVIRVKEGDTIHFTLTNKTTVNLSHSIDFHAAQTPWDKNYQPVAPGEQLEFDWVARFPGVFMYHCGVTPVLQHIANGMYGAIIVEPKDALPAAREYVLTSSEFYPGPKPVHGAFEGDMDLMLQADPEYVVFNGFANRYLDEPLVARPDELIRLWVMNAGPTLTNAFHVIGALFDHVYPDGNPSSPVHGVQTWNVAPGGGAMFELSIPDEGLYPFVTHSFAYTGRGATGVIEVDAEAPAAPDSYPRMATAADAGLTETEGTVSGKAPEPQEEPGHEEEPAGTPGKGALPVEGVITGFTPSTLEAAAGTVTIEFTNADSIPHDFTIDELEVKELVDPGGVSKFSFDAGPGSFTFYCSIPGHRESGMEGELKVAPGPH
jgi:nitrite reductase (NO-forming)